MGGKLEENKGYFTECVCTDPFQCSFPVSGDKDILFFLAHRGHLSQGKFYGLILSRKK